MYLKKMAQVLFISMFLCGKVGLCMNISSYNYYKIDTGKISIGGSKQQWLKHEIIIDFDESKQKLKVSFDSISLSYTQKDENIIYIPAPINLALPKNNFSKIKQWNFNDSKYEIVTEGMIELLGFKYDVFLIRQSINDCDLDKCDKRLFYYSLEHGLVAFSILHQNKRNEIWFVKQPKGILSDQ